MHTHLLTCVRTWVGNSLFPDIQVQVQACSLHTILIVKSMRNTCQKLFGRLIAHRFLCIVQLPRKSVLQSRLFSFAQESRGYQIINTSRTLSTKKNSDDESKGVLHDNAALDREKKDTQDAEDAVHGLMDSAAKAGDDFSQYAVHWFDGTMKKNPSSDVVKDEKKAVTSAVKVGEDFDFI